MTSKTAPMMTIFIFGLWDMIYGIYGSLMPRFKRGCSFVTSNVYHFGPRLWWLQMARAGPSLLILFLTCSVSNLFEHHWTCLNEGRFRNRRRATHSFLLSTFQIGMGQFIPKHVSKCSRMIVTNCLDRVSFQNHLTIAANRKIKFINLSAIFIDFRDGL